MARAGSPSTGRSPSDWMIVGGVLALATGVFLPVLGFHLVYDDGWILMANGFLRNPGHISILFTPEAVAAHVPDAFRPTSVLFDVVAYQLLGDGRMPHHALSLLLHVSVCGLLWRWLISLRAPLELRATATGIFAVLAIHAEAVAVVSYREDLLAAALVLGALLAAGRSLDEPRPARWWAFAFVLSAAAAGAKMSAAPAFVVGTLSWALAPWRPPPRPRRIVAGCAALGAGTGLLVVHTQLLYGGVSPYGDQAARVLANHIGMGPVVAESLRIASLYLQRMVVPLGMSPEYIDQGASWWDPGTALCALGWAGALGYGLWAARRRRRPLAAWIVLTTVAWLLPVSNLVPLPNMEADRFTYLPSIPVCVGLAAMSLEIGTVVARRLGRMDMRWAPAVVVVVVQGSAAQAQARVYRSDMRIWETARRRAPGSARSQAMAGLLRLQELSRARVRTGHLDQDLAVRIRGYCANALRLDPADPLPHMCQARLAIAERNWSGANRALHRAVALGGPRTDRALAALAEVSLDGPDPDRRAAALSTLARGLDAYPYSADLATAAGRVHHRLGHPERALVHYRRARSLRPERWEVVAWGFELALDLGDAAAAREVWHQHANLLQDADLAVMAGLMKRFADLRRLHPSRPHPLLDSGVFPP